MTQKLQQRILGKVSALLKEAGVRHRPIKNGFRITYQIKDIESIGELVSGMRALLGNRHYRHFLVETREGTLSHDFILKPRDWKKLFAK